MTEYQRPSSSAREVVQGYRQRIYSSDWARPEALHSAAIARMERWLDVECPEPDRPYPLTGRFRAVLATWA
jgi:hypothetical protein